MAVACIKRDGESNEKVIGRWKKKTQRAGTLHAFRNRMRFAKGANKTKQKEGAIVREKYRAKRRKSRFYS